LRAFHSIAIPSDSLGDVMSALNDLRMVRVIFVLLIAANPWVAESSKRQQELYTENGVCRQTFCVNPIFPGLNDLSLLEQLVWQCSEHSKVASYLEFCKGAVEYEPALPSPNKTSKPIDVIIKAQDDAAATMYFYHLSGMGYEAWDHPRPSESEDECVQSVWRMVCYTYFPKAQAGCSAGQESPYQRPCAGPCKSYLQACAVECCDESLQCVFQHQVTEPDGTTMLQTGYVDTLGPAAECTGHFVNSGGRLPFPLLVLMTAMGLHWMAAAEPQTGRGSQKEAVSVRRRSWTVVPTHLLLCVVLVACSSLLSGCALEVPYHYTANWRKKPNYLVQFEFVPPGQEKVAAILNSCADPELPATAQCSGHGYCKLWNSKATQLNSLAFCSCERDWTGPECSTRRRSQRTTFFLSLFGGVFGFDYFYLGFHLWGVAKLMTLGGLGFWWLVDVIRTGAGPVYAHDYRVANDLPHWVFVLISMTAFVAFGFLFSLDSYVAFRRRKRDEMMKLHEEEEARALPNLDATGGPRFRGYGATMPGPLPNAGAPFARH
jgi:hypothetical protein